MKKENINLKNDYIDLFSPTRSINVAKILSFPIDVYQNTSAYLKSYISKDKKYYNNVYFKTIDGLHYKQETSQDVINYISNGCIDFK